MKEKKNSKKKTLRFSLLIFFVVLLLTVSLWDAYFNGSRPFDQGLASTLVLIMGSLFSLSAGLFSWSLESRRNFLEREVEKRTRELEEKNKELQNQRSEIENFIHIISHDLKAPIVSIEGFAAILKEEMGSSLPETSLDYLNRILKNSKHMRALIADLLEFSRVGRVEDENEVIDSGAVVQEVVAALRPEIEKRHVNVRTIGEFPKLWGSRQRLLQVLSNLIGNAVKYIGNRSDGQVEIGHSQGKSGMCQIWVKDNGVGIKQEYQEKIFQMFQRAPNQLNVEGSGIGLSIVKKIVELNGGSVSVESSEGKGSRFLIEWPLANSQTEKPVSGSVETVTK